MTDEKNEVSADVVERLRAILIETLRAAGGGCDEQVSNDFLALLPSEVHGLRHGRDHWKAEAARLRAELAAAKAKNEKLQHVSDRLLHHAAYRPLQTVDEGLERLRPALNGLLKALGNPTLEWGEDSTIEAALVDFAASEIGRLRDVIRWLLGPWPDGEEAGGSGQAIVRHMLGIGGRSIAADWPWDDGDRGRCVSLLKRFPDWAHRLDEIGRYSQGWATQVREIRAMLDEAKEAGDG
jgi:hypothetical protein